MDGRFEKSLQELETIFSNRIRDHEEKLQKALDSSGTGPSDIATLSTEFNEFKSFVMASLGHLRTQGQLLSLGMDRHETTMRRKILLLHGIPEKPNEKLNSVVVNVLTVNMKLPDVNTSAIEVCHRLGFSQAKPRPILIRFRDMEHRHLVWDNKTALKSTGYTVSEFLTKVRHRVFTAARKYFQMKYVWTSGGTINIVTPDKVRHKIESAAELETLTAQFPSSAATDAPATPSAHAPVAPPKQGAKSTRSRRR